MSIRRGFRFSISGLLSLGLGLGVMAPAQAVDINASGSSVVEPVERPIELDEITTTDSTDDGGETGDPDIGSGNSSLDGTENPEDERIERRIELDENTTPDESENPVVEPVETTDEESDFGEDDEGLVDDEDDSNIEGRVIVFIEESFNASTGADESELDALVFTGEEFVDVDETILDIVDNGDLVELEVAETGEIIDIDQLPEPASDQPFGSGGSGASHEAWRCH